MADATVLYAGPDDSERRATREALADAGLSVETAATLAAATDAVEERAFDCVVSAHDLPDGTGLDLLGRLRETSPDTAFVLFTAADPDELDTERFGDDIGEYVRRDLPEAHETLAELVASTVERRGQTAYPLPSDEDERLAAVDRYAVVESLPDAAFDRLSEVASVALDVPMAGIGIIDAHEQRFIVCRGAEFGSVPREETVCTHAMLETEVTVIEDLWDDPRFADREYLRNPDLRMYASANITTADGAILGTFCVYDHEPGTLDGAERELLALLAEEAAEQFDLRRRLREADADG